MKLPNIFWNIQKNYYLWSSMISPFKFFKNNNKTSFNDRLRELHEDVIFHILLSKMYKNCVPYISANKNHIITKYRGKFYDIYGEVDCLDGFRRLLLKDLPIVEKWSFRKHNLLKL